MWIRPVFRSNKDAQLGTARTPHTNSALESSGAAEKVTDGFPRCTQTSHPGRISAIKDPDYSGRCLPFFILSHPSSQSMMTQHTASHRQIVNLQCVTGLIPWIKWRVTCHHQWHRDMMSSPPEVTEARVVCWRSHVMIMLALGLTGAMSGSMNKLAMYCGAKGRHARCNITTTPSLTRIIVKLKKFLVWLLTFEFLSSG